MASPTTLQIGQPSPPGGGDGQKGGGGLSRALEIAQGVCRYLYQSHGTGSVAH